jgi:hypothetical protein
LRRARLGVGHDVTCERHCSIQDRFLGKRLAGLRGSGVG